ncbi:MAG: hypothetical protein E7466_06515 [Ruminococcaceae bacterium]|nr:hypothetical protein [Oscillospiraceae bacterium]MBQ3216063.1 hypothetical protein [Oscillospiraceae bacterium]
MENIKNLPIDDDSLKAVTGGGFTDDPANFEFITCDCGGYIFSKYNGVQVPYKEIKCSCCGYTPSDPNSKPVTGGYGIDYL